MAFNLKEVLIEEIALEGLDGITINTLWIRLKHRHNFTYSLDDNSKPYLWKCVLNLKGFYFYELQEERPDLIPYNRFHYIDPETKQYLETEHIPDDIYPLNMINEDGVIGSCSNFKTRKNITMEIREKKPTLAEVTEEYGSKLVIVASQSIRRETIVGQENDPDFEFDAFSYCILEKIARTRYNGEASTGKLSLQDFKESPKTMFYMLKKIKPLKVLRKQRLIVVNKQTNQKTNCFLYHLSRFYKEVGNRLNHELMNVAQYLAEKPECMEEVFKTKTDLKLFDVFKKLAQHTMPSGERYFEFIDVPWREKYPDAKPRDYMMKNHRSERKIRHIRLIPTIKEVVKSIKGQTEKSFDDDDDEDDEEEGETTDNESQLKFNRVYDEPSLYQVIKLINQSGSKGLCQVDLQHIMNASRLAVRRILVFLQKTNYVTTVLEDRGRQKTILYVGIGNIKENTARQNVKLGMQKFHSAPAEKNVSKVTEKRETFKKPDKPSDVTDKTKTKPKPSRKRAKKELPKITFSEEMPSDDKVSEIKQELKRLDENQLVLISPAKMAVKREIMKEMTQDAGVKVVIEELIPEKIIDKKTGKVIRGMERFGNLLTESHIRRANWILEVMNAIRIVENFRLLKLLRNREKEINLLINMDQKSLKRLVYALCEEGKLKSYKAIITMDARTKEFIYLCTPTTTTEDETLLRMIDEAKLRYFSVSQEELRNRNFQKKLQAKADKPAKEKKIPERSDLPQSALETIRSHREYRKKLAEKAPTMKYDRKAGLRYGLLPKMLRIQASHHYLFYLCYDTYGKPSKSGPKAKSTKSVDGEGSATKTKESSDGNNANTSEKIDADVSSNVTNEKDDVDDASNATSGKVDADTASNATCGKIDVDVVNNASSEKVDMDIASITDISTGSKAEDDAEKKNEIGTFESGQEHWRGEDRVDIAGGYSQHVENEPVVYCNEMTWRRYLPPIPIHAGYPRGWVLLSDCLLNMPVCLFCEMVNVCYKIDGLEEVLDHPQKRFYPVINLPFSLTQQLLHSKKYVQAFSTLCCYLAEMGLLSFGKEVLKEKDQMFIYLHQNSSLLDTKLSLKGYNKTQAPEGHVFPEKHFHFESLSDLQPYWEILQITAVNSNLGCKSMVHKDLEDELTFEEKSLKKASASYAPDTVEDNGLLPGDRRGGAGLDSSLFGHCLKNWSSSGVLKPNRKYKNISIGVGLKGGLDFESKREVVDHFNKNRLQGKERLVLSDDSKKPMALKKITRVVAGNKGGKGVLRRVHTELTKTHKIISRMEGKLMKKRCIKLPERVYKKKKPYEKGDEKDKTIYRERCKMRVMWSSKEDSVLLMCRLATLIMDNKKKTALISYIRIRDYLHYKCGAVSLDKTSQAVQRRIKFVLKNPQTETNLLLYYREAMQDEFVLTNYVSKEFIMTDEDLESKFRTLVEYLLDKFKSLDLQKCSLPDNLEQLRQKFTIQYIGKLQPRKIYNDVKNKTDICQDVLRNILHSAVLLQDKQGRTHEMFKLLSQYPDALLSAVVRELRTDGLFVINKKHYQRESVSQLQTGMGLRNFKVSQRYLYQYKHRYLSVMFEESAKLVTDLCDKHLHGNEDERLILPFHPSSGECAALFPLILNKWLDFKITMPQELVIVDMEGFYKFPWGRGKNSSSQTKGDKMLQDIKLPSTSKGKSPKDPDGKSKQDKGSTENKASKDLDDAVPDIPETDNLDEDEENAMDVEPVASTSSQCGKEVDKETGDQSADKNSKSENQSKTNDQEKDLGNDPSGSETSLKDNKSAKDRMKDIGKAGTNVSSDSTHVILNNSSLIIPDFDTHVSGDMPGLTGGIASRTLLSLRRAEDCSFDDIRIFNAQDNFVVNSCEIGIKIRKDRGECKGGNPTVKRVLSDENKSKDASKGGDTDSASVQQSVDDKTDEKMDSDLKEQLMKEKMENLSHLLLDKVKIKQIHTDLQKLLPFQIDINEVWANFKDHGTSKDELNLYKKVYQSVHSHGEIGVRSYDLKKEFQNGVPWSEALDVLISHSTNDVYVCVGRQG